MRYLQIVLLTTLLLSGCSSLKFWEDDAVAEGAEQGVENATEPKKLQSFEEGIVFKKQWRASVGKGQKPLLARMQPALLDDHVVAADSRGIITAYAKESGDSIWRTELQIVPTGGVGVGGDLILVGSVDGELFALSAGSGEQLWQAQLSSEILSPPAADQNIVVVQTQDGKLLGFGAASGELLWTYVTELPVLTLRGTAAPVLAGNMVVAGFANGKVVALDIQNGSLLWETRLAAGEGKTELERIVDVSTPVVVGDQVHATSYQGRVGSLSRGVGRELWAHAHSSYLPPGYGSGRLYAVDTNGKISAFRAASGQQLWENEDLLRRRLTAPVVAGDFVVVGDREGYLHALAFADGSIVGRVKVDGDGVSVPAAVDGDVVFVQDNSGDITAYKLVAK